MPRDRDIEQVKKDISRVKTDMAVVKNEFTHIKTSLVRIEKCINGTAKEVKLNTDFRNQMIGKISFISAGVGTVVTIVLNWLFKQRTL